MPVRMAGTVLVVAVIMLLTGVQAQYVTLSSQSICAVTGSTVKISCTFTHSYSSWVREREWYLNSDVEERVLKKDPELKGRVSVSTEQNNCDLTVWDVRVKDSGVYNFRFKTSNSDWISASSGVNLTVTDLQMKVDPKTVGQEKVKVTCSSTCSLGTNHKYSWYTNGYEVYAYTGVSLELYSTYDEGRYSCGVSGSSHRSPSVCVFGTECWGVTYSPQHVCAPKGSSVDLSCSYKYPEGHTVKKTVWFIKQQTEPEDLREDEEYQGRVQNIQNSQNDCSIRINNLRESDTQTYRFRFYTDHGGGYTGQPGVTLTVTDLKVTLSKDNYGTYLICSSTCTRTDPPTYIWYKNGQPVSNKYSNKPYIYYSRVDAGSYSCAIKGHEALRSPAVCVFNRCWSITYATQSICAVIGSTVDIKSFYTFPDQHPEPQPAWYIKFSSHETELRPADDLVEFSSDRANVTTLTLKHLTHSDSAQYLLRFKTPYRGYTQSSAGVSLSVTDLQVKVSNDADGQTRTLTCRSSCTPTNNPTYIWYKNGQSLSHCRSKYCSVSVVSGAVNYSCSVEGHESFQSPPVYSPRNTRAELVSSREIVEGNSVTLSCSSDANPPVLSYSWFNQREPAETPLTTDQNYIITNISSQNSGFYYCTARNQLGKHNSTPIHLNVLYPPRNTRAELDSSGEILEGNSVTLSCSSDANPPDLSYSWFNQREPAETPLTTDQNYIITNISSQNSGFYYCTARNQLGNHSSTPIHLDVLYPPRNLTLSSFVTGDSVTLMCVSDANPASSYTWYRKTESDITLVGNSTKLTVPAGEQGVFYCMASNTFASYNSSEWSFTPADNTSAKYAASAVPVVFLLILIAVFLWLRKRAATTTSRSEENSEKDVSTPVYDNVPAMTSNPSRPAASDDEDDIQYSSVVFKRSHVQEVSLYSTVQQPRALKEEEDEVEYATVNLVKQKPVRKTKEPIYSMVQET